MSLSSYACVCLCIDLCMHLSMCASSDASVSQCAHAHTYVCATSMHAHTYMCIYLDVYLPPVFRLSLIHI